MTIDEKRMERDRELNVARQNNAEAYEQAKKPTALVQKLVKAIRHLDDSIYYWAGYVPKHIMEDKGMEYEEDRAIANVALTKAEAWLAQQEARGE